MISIFKKETHSFFSGIMAYLVLASFLTILGLFLWVFKGDYNQFDYGFSDLIPYFNLLPWVLLILIPAITMRTFAEERKVGTLELLLIKPLGVKKLILGKFFASWFLVILALLPTITYVLTIYNLGLPEGNYEAGVLWGSYVAILLLSALYCSIGLWASSITNNQVVALLLAGILCFLCYFGIEASGTLFSDGNTSLWVSQFGAKYHVETISKGIFRFSSFWFFVGWTFVFLYLAHLGISHKKPKSIKIKNSVFILSFFLLSIALVNTIKLQWDLTQDKRFTLSEESILKLERLNGVITVDVLLDGPLTPEFARLRAETLLLLENFKRTNGNLLVKSSNPLSDTESSEEVLAELQNLGITPASVTIKENGKTSQEYIIPWALVNFGNKTEKVALLRNSLGADLQARVNNSIQNLEYAFADAFTKLSIDKKKAMAILKGNGELEDIQIADFLRSVRDYYKIAPFTLEGSEKNPQKNLEELIKFDLIVIAGASKSFSENHKLILDQYFIQGGASLWLLDGAVSSMDSIQRNGGQSIAYRNELNLTDLLFNMGVRINNDLVEDLYNTPVVIANGEGRNSSYTPLPCNLWPMVFSQENHPINTNLDPIKFEFASSIDTLANGQEKTILLRSSPLSKSLGLPQELNLKKMTSLKKPEAYENGIPLNLGVLVEGKYSSMYAQRVKPFDLVNYKSQSAKVVKSILISDSDLIRNQIRQGNPLELGYDMWTNTFYDNKNFLLNAVNYLLEDEGLVSLRSKKINIPILDIEKVVEEKTKWQWINLGFPIIYLFLLALVSLGLRSRYKKQLDI